VTGRLIEVDLRNRASRSPTSKHHSFSEKAEIIALVEQSPELSSRELAVRFTDERKYFV
jgi:hypothetical protein